MTKQCFYVAYTQNKSLHQTNLISKKKHIGIPKHCHWSTMTISRTKLGGVIYRNL